jgi:hypothetical protein
MNNAVDHLKNGGHLQGLVLDLVVCFLCISHYSQDVNRCNPVFFSIRNGSGIAFGNEILSLRIMIDFKLEEAEWMKVRYEQLNLVNEKRIAIICHHQLY